MNQIEELQSRLVAAMDRVSNGLGALEAAGDKAAQADMEQALEEERLANAQLQERLKVLRAELADQMKQSGNSEDMAALQAEVELLRNEVGNTAEKDALKSEVSRLNTQLEVARNEAAQKIEQLESQLSDQPAPSGDDDADLGAAVDQAAMQAEIDNLRSQLEAAQSAPAAPAGDDSAEELARQNEMLVRLDNELQQLRHANEQLREANVALRTANAEGVGDASLINAAMQAEIEGLRAAHASDQAQVNAVLAKLEPLLANAQNLPEGEEV